MKKTICLLFILIATVPFLKAQELSYNSEPILHQKSIQFTAGTQGIGAEFSYGVLSRLAFRIGATFIPLSANNIIHISGFSSTSKASASFSNIHLLADFTPIKSAPGLRLVAGGAYFMQANGNFEVQPTGNYTYGDIVLSNEQVGKMNMNADWKGVAPYLGLGLVKVFPSHRFNVNLDLGSYYLNQPNTQIIGTGILEGNSSQTAQLQKNISGYRFLPVVQLNFSFKL